MTAHTWPPGTVAMHDGRRVMLVGDGDERRWIDDEGDRRSIDPDLGFHPLVVIDLPYGALAGWPTLIEALRRAKETTGLTMIFDGLIEQIEAQTATPTPRIEEPTLRYAVVEDSRGVEWIRPELVGFAMWHSIEGADSRWSNWADLDVVRVLSPGATDADGGAES